MNGGTLNILCDGSTGEGDGIDSNGWLVINGGTINSQACAASGDAGIDSDKGIYINGGKVVASGNMLDKIAGGEQTYAVFSFSSRQVGDSTYTLKNGDGKAIGEYAPTNDFTYLLVAGDELTPGDYTFWQGDTQLSANSMSGMPQGERPQMPNGEIPEGFTPPENGNRPEMPQGERPQMPNGETPEGFTSPEMPNGERPQMPENMEDFTPPEGMENMTPPNGMSGQMPTGEASTTFTIVRGGNQFANVSPATK